MADEASARQDHLNWQSARIESLAPLSEGILRVLLRPQQWHRPAPGQHLDVRLTADDGYQAQRSYSLLSPPESQGVYELGIELMPDGEVSPWFHGAAQVGDEVEVIGPVGGHFTWHHGARAPALLVGGGSGVVPLLAMAAHRARHADAPPVALCVSARTLAHVPLWDQLQAWDADGNGFRCQLALSRQGQVPRPRDRAGRLQLTDLATALQWLGDASAQSAQVFVCGSNRFVEAVVAMLRGLNVPDGAVRTERFGG